MANPFEDPDFGMDDELRRRPRNPFEDPEFGRDATLGESLVDTTVAGTRGALVGTKAISDAAGANNRVSRALDTAAEFVGGFESAPRRAEREARQRKIEEAERSGSTADELGAYLGAFAEAPLDTTVEALGTSLPTIGAAIATRGRSLGTPAAIGAVQGAGITKGSIYDAVERAYLERGAAPEDAAAHAEQAQAYNGKNYEQILLGAGLGAAAGSSGIESAVGRMIGNRAGQGIVRSTVSGALKEAPLEGLQGGQERFAGNLAQAREGFDTPLMEGVLGSAALEAVAGGAAGGGFGLAEGLAARDRPEQSPPPDELSPPTDEQSPPEAPPAGPQFNAPPPAPILTGSPGGVRPPATPEQYRREIAGRGTRTPRLLPSQQMGLDPAAGPLTTAAAMAVDTGLSQTIAAAAEQAEVEREIQAPLDLVEGELVDHATGEVIASPELRREGLLKRLGFLRQQARTNGWSTQLTKQRAAIEGALQEVAGETWTAMSREQREAVVSATDIKGVLRKNLPTKSDWAKLNPEVRAKLTAAIDSPAGEIAEIVPEQPTQPPQEVANVLQTPERSQQIDEDARSIEEEAQPAAEPAPQSEDAGPAALPNFATSPEITGVTGITGEPDIYKPGEVYVSDTGVYVQITGIKKASSKFERDTVQAQVIAKREGAVDGDRSVRVGEFWESNLGLEPYRGPGWRKEEKPEPETADEFRAADAAASNTKQPPEDATKAPEDAKQNVGTFGDIHAITRKQIPEMTDDEIAAAIEHYGPDHKRTGKLKKEQGRRLATRSDSEAINDFIDGRRAEAPTLDEVREEQGKSTPTAASVPAKAKARRLAELNEARRKVRAGTPERRDIDADIQKLTGKAPEPFMEPSVFDDEPAPDDGEDSRTVKSAIAGVFMAQKSYYSEKKKEWSTVDRSGLVNAINAAKAVGVEATHRRPEDPTASESWTLTTPAGNGFRVYLSPTGRGTWSELGKTVPGAVTQAAAEAATSPENDLPPPTEAMIEAGNFKKGHVTINGMEISIENPAGTRRRPEWPPLAHHYGYFRGTVGKDKDHVDVFLTDDAEDLTRPVYVVDQVTRGGVFDEHKVILGASNSTEARQAYQANYGKGWSGFGGMEKMSWDQFKEWVRDPANTAKPAVQPEPIGNESLIETKDDGDTVTFTAGSGGTEAVMRYDQNGVFSDELISDLRSTGIAVKSEGYLDGIRVTPALRRNRLGTALLKAVIDQARAKNLDVLTLRRDVSETKDEVLADFYRKAGFQESDKDPSQMYLVLSPQRARVAKPAPAPAEYGSANKLVSKERAEELRKRLKAKFNEIRTGIDPEMLAIGTELAVFHIEAGARKFLDVARAISDDIGVSLDRLKPYLRGWYNGARDTMEDNGLDVSDMDSTETVREQLQTIGNADERPTDAPPDTGGAQTLRGGRGSAAQQAPAPGNNQELAPGRAADSGPAGEAEPAGRSGLREPATDVADNAGVPGRRNAGNGRKGTGRARAPSDESGRDDLFARSEPDAVEAAQDASPPVESPAATQAAAKDLHIDNPLEIVGGTPMQRFNRNRAALELLQTLQSEGRQADPDEQKILAGYIGWGSFGQELFQGNWQRPQYKDQGAWKERYDWLRDMLGQSAWESAQRSITNAHYTDPPTVMAMWDMVKRMGFEGGRVLEPSMGTGNFVSMMPRTLKSRSQLTGIELDETTGAIAQQLFPKSNVQIMGYQDSKTPDDFYDLIIGNWPFENTPVADRRYNKINPMLHDYFFLKTMDQVRPGGIVIGITSAGSMDKQNTAVRRELARKAELITSIRLPSGAFEEYAGTKVVTDIVILRKRPERLASAPDVDWIETVEVNTPSGKPVRINQFYAKNPQNIIGTLDHDHGTTTFRAGMVVRRPDNMAERLKESVNLVPENAFKPRRTEEVASYYANRTGERHGALAVVDGKLMIAVGDQLTDAANVQSYAIKDAKKTAQREQSLKDIVALRKARTALADAERAGTDATAARRALKKTYEQFVKDHGKLRPSWALTYLRNIDDPFYAEVAALENDDGTPAAVMERSTVRSPKSIKNPGIADAYIIARNKSVNPSLEEIATAAGKPADEVKAELVKSGAIFELPSGDIAPADIYLSGNVRVKMREAEAALAAGNEAMKRNIAELKKVMPEDVPYFNIEAKMGATWVPSEHYESYIAHMLSMPNSSGIKVTFQNGRWNVKFNKDLNSRPEARSNYGTGHYSFSRLVQAAMSNQVLRLTSKDSDGKDVYDEAKTEEVNGRIAKIREDFATWLWSDAERKVDMEREYNEARNAWATPVYDGSFMTMDGMALSVGNGPFDLRQHQKNAIWRAVVNRRSINAHEVGTGKTYTAGGIAVESRRYGIANKPLLLAHNANSATVAKEVRQMYPDARVLYIDNLTPAVRQIRLRQIANDDWDLIVMPHSLLDNLSLREETLMAMAKDDIAALEAEFREAAAEDNIDITKIDLDDEESFKKIRSPTAKELAKQRKRIIESIKKQAQRSSKEGAVAFEDLGVDMLLVDEVHEFKKPPIVTRMKMKGLNTQTSARSIGLQFLTRYIRQVNNGGNVHTFTGTPITNTITEIYHQMRYVMEAEMADAFVSDWDGWFGSFASEVQDVELTAAGEYEMVTRLAGFVNVPELRKMVGQYMDTVFAEDMPEMKPRRTSTGKTMADELTELERAELLNGRTEKAMDRPYKKVINATADMTPAQEAEFARLQDLAKQWRNASGKERKEIMRTGDPRSPIITEGLANKASFDVRMLDEEAAGQEGKIQDHPNSKASRVVANVLEIYNSHKDANQVIFADTGYNKTAQRSAGRTEDGEKLTVRVRTFSPIHDIVERLVQGGIPRNQIAVVDGSTSKEKRREIAEAMNDSRLRVVIGSTDTLGVGVNMQRNLRAMHHLDAPYMPGELEQRNGRGQRQGNQWNTVLEYRYMTDRLDGRRWQILAVKQRFITAFMKASNNARIIEGEAAADEQSDILESFSEAAGDPRILQRTKLQKKEETLLRKERLHTQGMADLQRKEREYKRQAEQLAVELEKVEKSGALEGIPELIDQNRGDNFQITLDGQPFTTRADATEFLKGWVNANMRTGDPEKALGEYGGYPISIYWPKIADAPELVLTAFGRKFSGRGILGLEAKLRNFPASVEADQANLRRAQETAENMRKAQNQPFGQAADLERVTKQLADLEKDLEVNPVPPPAWLRQGAPIDSAVYRGKQPFVVIGHRYSPEGWFVVAEDDKGTMLIPYMEATDEAGMPIYEERPFVPPAVQTKAAAAPDNTPKYSRAARQGQAEPITEQNLEAAIAARFPRLAPAVAQMLARGKEGKRGGLVVINSADPAQIAGIFAKKTGRKYDESLTLFSDGQGAIQGFYDARSGLTFMVGPNVTPTKAAGVLLHEIYHSDQRASIDQRAQSMIDNRTKEKNADLRALLDRVAARMADAGQTGNQGEAAAYIIEQAVTEGRSQGYSAADSRFIGWVESNFGKRVADLVSSFAKMVRQWMLRHGLPVRLTVGDLVDYAMAGVNRSVNRGAGGVAMSRAADQTQTPTLRQWLEQTRVVKPGDTVDGRTLREGVPNTGSIDASLDNYTVLNGVREIPLSAFDQEYVGSISTDKLDARTRRLAEQIRESGEIAPVIVVADAQGLYILEGGHRYDALIANGAVSLPAMVVIDESGGANPDIRFSRAGDMAANMARDLSDTLSAITVTDIKNTPRKIRSSLKDRGADWLRVGLQWLGRRQIVDIYGGEFLPLEGYASLAEKMQSDENAVAAKADEIAQRWGKVTDQKALADLMHDATLAGIDADDQLVYEGAKMHEAMALRGRFAQLTPEAKAIYRETRDTYKEHHQNVLRAMKDRIRRSEMNSARKAELLQRMDAEFYRSVPGVYFPLQRFGKYVVTAHDANHRIATVQRAETMSEAQSLRNDLLQKFPASGGYQVSKVTLDKDFAPSRDSVGRGFISSLYEALDEMDLGGRQQAELEDTIGQLYLSSFPDMSWAKHGIHRKGTPGFSDDARRAFAQNMFHGGRYLARLRYSERMRAELEQLQKYADQRKNDPDFDQPRAQRVIDEMAKRHDAMMNPDSAGWASLATSAGFFFFLGFSPASAAVNLSQTVLVGLPLMGAKTKWGFDKSAAELMKASRQAFSNKNRIRDALTPEEKRAFDLAVRDGTIDVTQAMDLNAIAQGEDSGLMWALRPLMRLSAKMFHEAEVFNRQVTFIAAYRLARQAGDGPRSAFLEARQTTYDVHFDYSVANRPRITQGNAARVVLLFKQYAQNMIYTMLRNTHQSFAGESPEVRREARRAIAGIMGLHFLAAGALGLPLVGPILWALSALGSDDDEPWDAEVAMRNGLADLFGGLFGEPVGRRISEVLSRGVSRLTPLDISGRVALNSLIFPDMQEGLEGARWAERFITQLLGPVASMMVVNPAKALNHLSEGRWQQALESFLPVAASNALKSFRFASEGVVDRSGVVVRDDVSWTGVGAQFFGFAPSEVRRSYEGREAIYNTEQRLNSRRSELLRAISMASIEGDTEAAAEARAEIAEFNRKNPSRAIKPTHIMQSVKARRRRIEQAEQGVYLPKNRREALEAGRFADY